MERGNFSAAAGFGAFKADRFGVFSTFSAFSEMIISELTMARLNFANVLTHFSHSGVDEMADNTWQVASLRYSCMADGQPLWYQPVLLGQRSGGRIRNQAVLPRRLRE